MNDQQERIYLNGPMDQDAGDSVMKSGRVRSRLNMRVNSTELSNAGECETVRGNVELVGDLPAGENICIGSVEDYKKGVQYWLFRNSQDNHSIAKVDPASGTFKVIAESPLFNFKEGEMVTGIEMLDRKLLWASLKNTVRRLEMDLADREDPQEWEIYFGHDFASSSGRVFQFGASGPANIVAWVTPNSPASREDLADQIASGLNGTSDFAQNFTAKSCGRKVIVTALVNTNWAVTFFDTSILAFDSHIQPTNEYIGLNRNVIDITANPFTCPVSIEAIEEAGRLNLIQGKFFQFSVRPIRRDGTRGALSAYSTSSKIEGAFNGIRIDFTDSRLSDPVELVDLVKVEICVRERNLEAWGGWRKFAIIPREDFFFKQTIDFFNDGDYAALSDNESASFNAVPQRAEALSVITNEEQAILSVANTVEGKSGGCNTLVPTVTYQDQSEGVVTMRIRVLNALTGLAPLRDSQPIQCGEGTDPRNFFYGGSYINSSLLSFRAEAYKDVGGVHYKNNIPAGGWTIFAEGTDYRTTSKQNVLQAAGLNMTLIPGTTVYDTSQQGGSSPFTHRNAVLTAMSAGEVYSTAELRLPPGRYVIGVASHLVSDGDILNIGGGLGKHYDLSDPSRLWQKTSANVEKFGTNPFGNPNVEVYADHAVVTIPQGGGTFDLGEVYIMDNIDVDNNAGCVLSLYGMNNAGNAVASAFPAIPEGESMERQQIVFRSTTLTPGPSASFLQSTYGISGLTDKYAANPRFCLNRKGYGHIGFRPGSPGTGELAMLGVSGDPSNPTGSIISTAGSSITVANLNLWRDYGENLQVGNPAQVTSTITSPVFLANYEEYILENRYADSHERCRTTVTGTVIDQQGVEIGGASVIVQGGATVETLPDGTFTVPVYGDMCDGAVGDNFNRRTEVVTITLNGQLFDSPPYNIIITNFEAFAQYSNTIPFAMGDLSVTNLGQNAQAFLSRNATYYVDLIHRDRLGQYHFVEDPIKLEIPEITENQIQGSPVVDLLIKGGVPIPELGERFVAAYPVVSANQRHSSRIMWTASDVKYVRSWDSTLPNGSKNQQFTTYANASEIAIKVDFLLYSEENTNSFGEERVIQYQWELGDVLIPLFDELGNVFPEYYGLQVRDIREENLLVVEARGNLPEFKPGMVFRLVKPREQLETTLTFEVGQCIPIDDPYGTPSYSQTSFRLAAWDSHILFRSIPTRLWWDNTATTPAIPPIVKYSGFFESQTPNDYTSVKLTNGGIAVPVTQEFGEEEYPVRVRISDAYFPGTKVNGFGTWFGTSTREANRDAGAIRYIRAIGDSLTLVQERRVRSIYLGRVTTSSGSQTISFQDAILTNSRESIHEVGTINPESCYKYLNRLYFFDAINGKVVTYSTNGVFEISAIGMENYFQSLGRQIMRYVGRTGAVPRVRGTWSRRHNEYQISVQGVDLRSTIVNPEAVGNGVSIPDTTITYFEGAVEQRGWESFWSHHGDWYQNGNGVVSYKDGSLWLHDQNQTAGRFYGDNYEGQVTLVAGRSNEYDKRKVFNALEVLASGEWYAPLIEAIEAGRVIQRTNMENFSEDEGDLYKDFNRDTLSGGTIEGRELRAHSLNITLATNSTEIETLQRVFVHFQFSERSIR